MTQDEIIEMARHVAKLYCMDIEDIVDTIELVAAKEREACAQLVDHILKAGGGTWGDAIRARGES